MLFALCGGSNPNPRGKWTRRRSNYLVLGRVIRKLAPARPRLFSQAPAASRQPCLEVRLPRLLREVLPYSPRRLAAFGYRPHHERLAPAHVAGGEDARH